MSHIDRYNIEHREEWRKWVDKIPAIEFDQGWKVKVIPPFAGAIARFLVETGDKSVSVYLDCFNALGFYEGPYWEVYPYNDDVGRCSISDTDELLNMIRYSLSPNK